MNLPRASRHRGQPRESRAPDAPARLASQCAPTLRCDDRQRSWRSDLPESGEALCRLGRPNSRLWVADITYLPSRVAYLAAILDAWSRKVVGDAIEGLAR